MNIENKAVNALRIMSVNMIEKANSGHPGVCLGAAPIFYSIYKKANVVPSEPKFFNRDRVVFSAGHSSALIYSTLNLFGYNISINDLKQFRKLGSITSGHPEIDLTPGVDVSTGPLGQGIANAVGLAIAETNLSAKFNKENFNVVDHYTYCFCGDGCLMEGVALEAISLAGHLALNKLILLYDKNDITIEGKLDNANGEDIANKFRATNWNVLEVEDANNIDDICNAIDKAKESKDKPTIIIIKSHIGFGSELQDNAKVHGSPLNKEQIATLRANLGYDESDWVYPKEVLKHIKPIIESKNSYYKEYQKMYKDYSKEHPEEYKQLNYQLNNSFDFASICKDYLDNMQKEDKSTRELAGKILNYFKDKDLSLIGGAADVAPSTKIYFKDEDYYSKENRGARNIHYGVREHAMGAISNGIALHGGLKPFCSTFFTFENYMTPAIRMSALMDLPVSYYFTHDTIAVGEDGPTHQPIEQIATLRAMPNLTVFRPCGEAEVLAGIYLALTTKNPTSLVLSRQTIPQVNDDFYGALNGAYVIKHGNFYDKKVFFNNQFITKRCEEYDATVLCAGSEVHIVLKAAEILAPKGIVLRVVSMPSVDIFERTLDEMYKNYILGNNKVMAVEISSDSVWYRYVTNKKYLFNLEEFSKTGNEKELYEYYKFNPEKLAERMEKLFLKDSCKVVGSDEYKK